MNGFAQVQRHKDAKQKKTQGNEYFQQGQFEAAVKLYSEAIELDSTNYIYPLNRSACYMKMERWKSCINDCKQAIDLGLKTPQNDQQDKTKLSKAFARYAEAELALKEYNKALIWFSTSVEFMPSNSMKIRIEYVKKKIQDKHSELTKSQQKQADYIRESQCCIDDVFLHPQHIHSSYECTICTSVFTDPAILNCGHTFCKQCIQDWLSRSSSCPICRRVPPNNNLTPNIGLRDAIDTLKVQCPRGADGGPCGWVGSYGKLKSHLDRCPHFKVLCYHPGCTEVLTRGSLEDHASTCVHRPKYCNRCGVVGHNEGDEGLPCAERQCECKQKFTTAEYYLHRHQECPCQPVRCPQSCYGCPVSLRRDQIDAHNATCGYSGIGAMYEVLEGMTNRISTLERKVRNQEERIEQLNVQNMEKGQRIESLEAHIDKIEKSSRSRPSSSSHGGRSKRFPFF